MSFRECFKRGIEKLCSTEPDYVPCPLIADCKDTIFSVLLCSSPLLFSRLCVLPKKVWRRRRLRCSECLVYGCKVTDFQPYCPYLDYGKNPSNGETQTPSLTASDETFERSKTHPALIPWLVDGSRATVFTYVTCSWSDPAWWRWR